MFEGKIPDLFGMRTASCGLFRFWHWLSSWDWLSFGNTAVAAGLGAAVGALIAFLIEDRKRKERLEDEHVAAANIAVAALARAWNNLESFREQRIEPVRNNPLRWCHLTPGNIIEQPSSFDPATLAFLFETSQPDLPVKVQTELDHYETIRIDILVRTREHVENLQPRMEAAGRQLCHASIVGCRRTATY